MSDKVLAEDTVTAESPKIILPPYRSWRDIPLWQYPVQVWADHNYDWVAMAIKARTHANYSHVMWMVRPGVLVTQGFITYHEEKIETYMRPGNRLKFIGMTGLTDDGRQAIISAIDKKLHGNWIRKGYDWIGVFGQLTGMTWIQLPWIDYCSEDMPGRLKEAALAHPAQFDPELYKVIMAIPKNASPGLLDDYSKRYRAKWFPWLAAWEDDNG